MRALVFVGCSLGLVACGGDDGPGPGEPGGPCLPELQCPAPLTCASDVCVDLSEAGTGAAESDGGAPGDDGAPGDGAPDDGSADDGSAGDDTVIECSHNEAAAQCSCSRVYDPDASGPPATCTPSLVGAPAQCCASSDWPTDGRCSCDRVACVRYSDTVCACLRVTADGVDGASPVPSCSQPDGVCCLDDGGSDCACYGNAQQCPFDGDVIVGSCTLDSLACGHNEEIDSCT